MAASLPSNIDAEKVVLGSILLDAEKNYPQTTELRIEDFILRQHQMAFRRIRDLHERGDGIDRVTLTNELMNHGELEACGGFSYLVSLDDGLPNISNIRHYVGIVREKAALRRIIFLSQKTAQLSQTQEHAPAKILRDLSKTITHMEMGLATNKTLLSPQDILDEHGGVSNFLQHAIKPGISTGFPQVDEFTMGLQESCHYIIGGRTGSGKTSLGENIAINVAKDGHPVCFFSLEMSKELLMARAICCEARVPFKAYIRNDMDPDQRHAVADALDVITQLPFYVDDAAGLTMGEFSARADRAVAEKGIRLFLLDYLQIMNAEPEMELRTEYDRVTYASKLCRMLARKHKNSSIAVSQLSRPADKRKPGARPGLSDLKASGGIENDAAACILIHRPEMFDHVDQSLKFKAEAIIAKSRVGGQGTVHLTFTGKYYRFEDNGPPIGAPIVEDDD